MTEPCYCPRCRAAITADSPAGLCPSCLMQMALERATESPDQSSGSENSTAEGAVADLAIPEIIRSFGDYELLQRVARGGMGVIYKARQICLNRIVAVKMMAPGLLVSEAEASRFQTEAEVIANLRHPNIVAVHDVGVFDGQRYFSMDYVEGQSLAAVVRDHPLQAQTAARQVKIIAEAIHYAHQQGILHRDLRPSNVLLDKNGNPRITDFGLAKKLFSDSRLTATGAVLGTPSYMPPEQADGKSNRLGPASDVYSLGAILYELLTGRPPFQAATPLDTILLVLNTEPIAPRMLNPKLSRDLETICLKCMEKDPRWRYQSAQELADDLDRYLKHEPIRARHIGLTPIPLRQNIFNYPLQRYGGGAFSPDGSLLAASGGEGLVTSVWIWDTETATDVAVLRNSQHPVWSGDGRLLATQTVIGSTTQELDLRGSGRSLKLGASIKIWEVAHSTPTYVLPKAASSLAFSPDSKQLVSDVAIWDVVMKFDHPQLQLSSQQLPEYVKVFGVAGQLWAAKYQYSKHPNTSPPAIRLWQIAPERREILLENPGYADLKLDPGEWFAAPGGLAVGPDGKSLVMACVLRWGSGAPGNSFRSIGEGTLELWDLTTQKRLGVLRKGGEAPARVSVSPDGRRLVTYGGGSPANVAIWDFATRKPLRRLEDIREAESALFGPDSRLLFSAGFHGNGTDGSINVHEVETGRNLGIWNGHQGRALALAISPDGRLLASGGDDHTIRLWEVPTGRELARWEAHRLGVTALAFSHNGLMLASSGSDSVLNLWDLHFIRRELAGVGLDW
jgi:serine/threonine protein kinase